MEFVCRIGTPAGEVVEEVRQARSERELLRELEKSGVRVFDVRRRGIGAFLRLPEIASTGRRIGDRELLIFNKEFAALLRSGLPVIQALDLMLERQANPLFREMVARVRDRVRGGAELSDAIAELGDAFPPLYAPTLKAGERSGELESVIRRFIRHQSLLMKARQRVASALVYPAALIGLSAILIGIMTVYVVPRFEDYFAGLGAELPLITRFTMALSGFVQGNLLELVVLLVVAVLGLRFWRRTAGGALRLDRWRLRLPLLGPIFHRLALSEFCRSLSTLLSGGLPALTAVEVSAGAVSNTFMRHRLAPVATSVREGESLHQALDKTGVVTEIAVDMVRVGEATGALAEMLSEVSNFLDEEVETRLERVLSLLEPVMLILMGVIVATLLTSVYLPMFNLLGEVRF